MDPCTVPIHMSAIRETIILFLLCIIILNVSQHHQSFLADSPQFGVTILCRASEVKHYSNKVTYQVHSRFHQSHAIHPGTFTDELIPIVVNGGHLTWQAVGGWDLVVGLAVVELGTFCSDAQDRG